MATFNLTAVSPLFLTVDGTGMAGYNENGGGSVSCTSNRGVGQNLVLITNSDGTVSIKSPTSPNVYLRMDGSTTKAGSPDQPASINCQTTSTLYENYRMTKLPDGTVSFESVFFPGVFLGVSHVITPRFGCGITEKFNYTPVALA